MNVNIYSLTLSFLFLFALVGFGLPFNDEEYSDFCDDLDDGEDVQPISVRPTLHVADVTPSRFLGPAGFVLSDFGDAHYELLTDQLPSINDHRENIPRVLVMGDRESGKSKIIQDLLGIQLPLEKYTFEKIPVPVKFISREGTEFRASMSLFLNDNVKQLLVDNIRRHDEFSAEFERASMALHLQANMINEYSFLEVVIESPSSPGLIMVETPTPKPGARLENNQIARQLSVPLALILTVNPCGLLQAEGQDYFGHFTSLMDEYWKRFNPSAPRLHVITKIDECEEKQRQIAKNLLCPSENDILYRSRNGVIDQRHWFVADVSEASEILERYIINVDTISTVLVLTDNVHHRLELIIFCNVLRQPWVLCWI